MSDIHGTVTTEVDDNPYGYFPTRSTAIIFLALFSISTLLHGFQAAKHRMWWLIPTAGLCGLIEIIGWSGRLWSSFNVLNDSAFQMQICCTIIGPTPLLAASFIILGNIIKRLGPAYSRLTPKWYTIIFCSCDVISLVIQAIGGGMAASAEDTDGANRGADIMLVGIVFQLLVIVFFAICASEFYYRYLHRLPIIHKGNAQQETSSNSTLDNMHGPLTRKTTIMTWALVFSTIVFFIRSIYRIIELADGWNGRIIQTEVYFNVLDGAMVILAIYTLNICHPGWLLPANEYQDKEAKLDNLNV